MGYIKCSEHGENVASLVSKYHANRANRKEFCPKNETITVTVIDKEKLFNGLYLVDSKIVSNLDIKDLKIDCQSDAKKFEAFFNVFVPVCPICLDNYLNNC